MRLRFRQVTRGHWKIYVRVAVEGLPEGATLRCSSRTATGQLLPSYLVDEPSLGDVVLVLAVLTRSQIARVEAVDAAGNIIASVEHDFNPALTRLRSQTNTALRKRAALSIRNIDDVLRTQELTIGLGNIVCRPDAYDDAYCYVGFIANDAARLAEPIELRVLDSSGNALPEDVLTISKDATTTSASRLGSLERSIVFSARIRSDIEGIVLWAHIQSDAIADAFCCIPARDLENLREAWRSISTPASADSRYHDWFVERHRTPAWELEHQRECRFEIEPSFSFIVPLYHTPLSYYEEMVRSVLEQTYNRLELVLVNASPEDVELCDAVQATVNTDPRVRVVTLKENCGITENTNAGIAAATGDFLCFLDHDDFIEPDLLFRYVEAINEYPSTDLLYCDEDKFDDTTDTYFCPFMKPDWSPELLCSSNYVCHLLTVRGDIVRKLEPAGSEFDGAQDHHMTFRVSEQARNIHHVRRVLYHWRSHPASTAATGDAKNYTTEAGRRAVQGHLDRCGISATAVPDAEIPNTFQMHYKIQGNPLVSIVIPSKDQADMLERCVASIFDCSTYANIEVVVVENNSEEAKTFALYEMLKKRYPKFKVVTHPSEPSFNFSRLINFGVAATSGEYLLLLNNDTEVITPDWIECLLGACMVEGVGVTGAKLLYANGSIQHAGVLFHFAGPDHLGRYLTAHARDSLNLLNVTQNLSAVTGACLMTSRSLFDELGGLDEEFAVAYNDIDYCLRAGKRGMRVVFCPAAMLYHYESVSRGGEVISSASPKGLRFCRENGMMMQRWARYFVYGDPYMNPNLGQSPVYRQLAFA